MNCKGSAYFRHVSLVVLTSTVLTGCSTVVTSKTDKDKIGNGVTYFLPKREVKLTAERKILVRSEIEKALKAKQAELEALGALIDAHTETIETARYRMEDPKVKADPQTLQIVENTLNLATADLNKANENKVSAARSIDILSMQLYTVKDGSCNYQYSAKIELQSIMADTKYRLVARDFHNPMRDDDTKLKVSTDGLLTSANVVSADRTGDIIVDIASAISGFGAGSPAAKLNKETPSASAAVECEKEPVKFVQILDPIDENARNDVNKKLFNAGIKLAIKSNGVPLTSEEETNNILNESIKNPESVINRSGGLYYRTPVPVAISVVDRSKPTEECTAPKFDNCTPIDGSIVMLPQAGPISYIPLNSSAFVKTVDDVTFENGMLTSWNSNRPSEVLEIVRLPVKILKSIVSVPAELIKLRIDLSDKEKGLAQAQESEMAAQAKLRLIQACVKSAGADQDKAQACFN